MIVAFGSHARGVERPNDVDIGCEFRPRFTGERQQAQEQVRRAARSEPFRNMSEWAAWPKLEVIRFLKGRARGRSVHQLEDWMIETKDHKLHGDRSFVTGKA